MVNDHRSLCSPANPVTPYAPQKRCKPKSVVFVVADENCVGGMLLTFFAELPATAHGEKSGAVWSFVL